MPIEKKKAMIEAVRNIPGVAAAGTVNRVPFTGGLRGVPIFQPRTTEFTLNNSVAGALRVYHIAGILGGCRHSASRWTGFLMAGHHRDALCGDRERNLRTQDVGRHVGA